MAAPTSAAVAHDASACPSELRTARHRRRNAKPSTGARGRQDAEESFGGYVYGTYDKGCSAEIALITVPDRPGDQLDIMHATRDCFPVAIDDFGTGVAHAPEALPDRHTEDRHLVIADLETDTRDAAIEAIFRAQANLGLKIVAEGVGTREQLEFLDVRVATRRGSN